MNAIIEKLEHLKFLTILKANNITINKTSVSLQQAYIDECKKLGINIENSIKNEHINDMYKNIVSKIFNNIVNASNRTTDIDIDNMLIKNEREDKLKSLFGESVTKLPISKSVQSAMRLLSSEIKQKVSSLNANTILTNTAMGAAIQDLFEFNYNDKDSPVARNYNSVQYRIGTLFGCDVYIDAYMRFNDNRIIIGDIDYELTHDDNIEFNTDLSQMEFGCEQKINTNSKVEVLNIIDSNILLF